MLLCPSDPIILIVEFIGEEPFKIFYSVETDQYYFVLFGSFTINSL